MAKGCETECPFWQGTYAVQRALLGAPSLQSSHLFRPASHLQSWTGAASNSGALQDEASSKAVVQSEGVIGLQRSWAVEAGDGDRYRLLLGVPNICVCQVSA